MEILVVELAYGASKAGAIESSHQVDVGTGEDSVPREKALVQGGLEGVVTGVTEEVMEVKYHGSTLDHLLGKVAWVKWDLKRESSSRN